MVNIFIVYGSVALGAFIFLLLITIGVICICKRKPTVDLRKVSKVGADHVKGNMGVETSFLNQAQAFQLAEIKNATRNFVNKIGEGAFGPVFYGKLPSGQDIAVKVLAVNSTQGSNEFFNEVNFLSRAHHKNVVSLLGYYTSPEERMLVYEYLSGGTLEDRLHGTESSQPLSWKARLKIALDAAKGLEYLHGDCNPTIIHRDVKSSNILLTEKLVAKVADFGFSKLGPEEGVSHVSTVVKGTSGYVDPEYYETQKLTQKSDVYSFGVVLLELLTGRDALISDPVRTYLKLGDWARVHLIAGNLDDIIDPVLGHSYNVDALWKVADIAMFSVEPRSIHRPNMSDVVQELKEALAIESGVERPVYEHADMIIQSTPWDDTSPIYSGTFSISLK